MDSQKRTGSIVLIVVVAIGVLTVVAQWAPAEAPAARPTVTPTQWATMTSVPTAVVTATVSPPPAFPTITPRPTAIPPLATAAPRPTTVPVTPVVLVTLAAEVTTATVATGLDDFVFGAPKIIDEYFFHLGEWVDYERLVASRCISGCAGYPKQAALGIYNIHTGEFQEYGQRQLLKYDPPHWLSATQQIVFRVRKTDHQAELWISGTGAQRATDPVLPDIPYDHPPPPLTVTDREVLILRGQPQQLVAVSPQGKLRTLPVDITHIKRVLQITVSPDHTTLAVLDSYKGVGRIYLIDLADYSLRALDWRTAVQKVVWSNDSHYLFLVAAHPRGYELHLLDVYTGVLLRNRQLRDIHFADDWSPDGRYFLAGTHESSPEDTWITPLLVDAEIGLSRIILPNSGCEGWALAWSPDGQTLILASPYQACVVDVNHR